VFIKQRPLKNKTAEDIPQITEFIKWKFLSAIYKSSWDELMANNENKTFRQYTSSQFNSIPSNNMTIKKLFKRKQANISRVLPTIPSRLSKSILAKFKFSRRIKL